MTLDEIAKLNKMVHPELEGACAICGIDPQAIKQLINQARIEAYNDIKNFATALDKGIISYESIVENRLKELKGGINE